MNFNNGNSVGFINHLKQLEPILSILSRMLPHLNQMYCKWTKKHSKWRHSECSYLYRHISACSRHLLAHTIHALLFSFNISSFCRHHRTFVIPQYMLVLTALGIIPWKFPLIHKSKWTCECYWLCVVQINSESDVSRITSFIPNNNALFFLALFLSSHSQSIWSLKVSLLMKI